MAGGTGGAFGYYLKQVGGSVLLRRNDSLAYDPASALKTLLLVDALRQVAAGSDSLTNPVTVYAYPNSRNANGDPASPDLCPDPADEVAANLVNPAPSLQTVLQGMMQVSNNRYTRAIELRYGRANINALAQTLGMSSTDQNQIFGCGNDNNEHNSWTLDDAGKLYEAISNGTAVGAPGTQTAFGMMLSIDLKPLMTDDVQLEAVKLGLSAITAQFESGIKLYQKGGSYDVCYTSCGTDDQVTRDYAGVAILPIQTPRGPSSESFVWGSFIANEMASCPSFPCPSADNAGAATLNAIPDLLLPAVQEALTTWSAPTLLAASVGRLRRHRLAMSARLVALYSRAPLAGLTIRFSVRGRTVCSSKTSRTGVARCTVLMRSMPSSYTARFGGSSVHFPTSTIGHISR
jgi:Beta-lactamase enzyme family